MPGLQVEVVPPDYAPEITGVNNRLDMAD